MKKVVLTLSIITVSFLFTSASTFEIEYNNNESVTDCESLTVQAGQTISINTYDVDGLFAGFAFLFEGDTYCHCETWAIINGIESYPERIWNDWCLTPQ